MLGGAYELGTRRRFLAEVVVSALTRFVSGPRGFPLTKAP